MKKVKKIDRIRSRGYICKMKQVGERRNATENERREEDDESSRLTHHRRRACLISVRRRRCGASAFGLSALSLHPFSKRPEHPVINNGAFWSLQVTGG